jgi:hypothetical protein
MKYLEYLVLDCGVVDAPIHTELGCLYVDFIKLILAKYKVVVSILLF